uniref:C2H2-type domain-containing protein n=1 Tax=Anopheles albimanus TaxID=7167 RepID=A0A182FGX2_ANOAL
MTMDIKQSRMNGIKMAPGSPAAQATLASDLHPNPHQQHHHSMTTTTKLSGAGSGGRASAGKRSFDVAFLMMPDEKLGRSKVARRPQAAAAAAAAAAPPAPAPASPTIDVESDSTQSEPRSEDLSHKSGFSPIRSPADHHHHFPPDVLQAVAAAGLAGRTHLAAQHHQHHQQQLHQQQQQQQQHVPAHQYLAHPAVGLGELQSERLAYLFPGAARFYEPPAGMMFGTVGAPFGRTGTRGSLSGSPDLPSAGDPLPPRSAFSKVTSIISVPDSPGPPPLSPDDTRQSCPSTSPPISLSPGGGGGSQHSQASGFRYEYDRGPFLTPTGSPPVLLLPGDQLRPKSFRSPAPGPPALGVLDPAGPDPPTNSYFHGTPAGGHFALANGSCGASPATALPPGTAPGNATGGVLPEVDGLMRNPAAAAILSTLLPSAMSTFTLSAQNVCAKCNISFRMTSDLVYHMRSHHKSEREVHDQARRKREDKLKCPVCNESFRERHHLTRHMTAHQDKAGDLLEPTAKSSSKRAGSDGAAAAAAARHHLHHHHQHQQQQQQQHPQLSLGGGAAGAGRLA